MQEIGEIFEKQENAERAMEYFDKAAELFSGEEVNSSGTQCKLKVAQFAAQLQQWVLLIAAVSFSVHQVQYKIYAKAWSWTH